MNKQTINRYFIYAVGTIALAIGLVLNTKTNLGVSPLISLPYAISEIYNLNFAFMTFLLYMLFVLLQFILKGKKKEYADLLQIPFSFVFSFLLDIFDKGYEQFTAIINVHPDALWHRLILLAFAVMFTGAGVAMMIAMCLIPNPADGLAKTVGETFKKTLGFGKNFIDITTVLITSAFSLIIKSRLVGVGFGTIVAMIGVGRCISIFNHFFKSKMLKVSGQQH